MGKFLSEREGENSASGRANQMHSHQKGAPDNSYIEMKPSWEPVMLIYPQVHFLFALYVYLRTK